jgi:ABC-type branched-subunit amino acid transport system substrate-binding protein
MSRRQASKLACILLLGALVAAGCGSSRKDDNGSSSPTTAAGKGTDDKAFGDLASPCGGGSAKGATDQGVTDSAITIGYGADEGFAPSPGLDHELTDAMKAMVKWCNDQGGILGRQIDGRYYDAKVTEIANAMTEACAAAFMLVGEGWSFDGGGEQKRVECGLPAVPGFAVSPAFAHGPGVVMAMPNPVDFAPSQNAAAIAKAFPDKIAKTAVMFGNYASTIATKDKVLASYPAFGFTFLPCPQAYNIAGEADYKPFVQKLKDCGAEIVYFTGAPAPYFENFLEAAEQLDYKPIYMTDANFYDAAFAKWNKAGLADQVYVRGAFPALDQADTIPAIRDYIDIVEADGGDISQLGEQATSAFLLWATAAKRCGSGLTRVCMAKELGRIHSWTGGGLHAETDPARNMPPSCGLVLKLDGTKFVQFAPKRAGELECSPDFVKPVTGPLVDEAKLGPDRVSKQFTG